MKDAEWKSKVDALFFLFTSPFSYLHSGLTVTYQTILDSACLCPLKKDNIWALLSLLSLLYSRAISRCFVLRNVDIGSEVRVRIP